MGSSRTRWQISLPTPRCIKMGRFVLRALRTISQRNRADIIAILPKAVPAHGMAVAHFRQLNVYETTIRNSLPYFRHSEFR
jgi:hypothetical protein